MAFFSLLSERSPTIVAAAFVNRYRAESAALALKKELRMDGAVTVISPGDDFFSSKLEPDACGIWQTLLSSHIVFGLAGLLFGLAAAIAIVIWSVPEAVSAPGYTGFFFGMIGSFWGVMLAGLITLRPDHAAVIEIVREWMQSGEWTVIARPRNESSARKTIATLNRAGGTVERSL